MTGQAGERADDAGRRDLADRVVELIGDVEVARGVDRDADAGWRTGPHCPCRRRCRRSPADPAKVVTTPAGVIVRIVWLPCRRRRRCLRASTATPYGRLNRAALPVPSVLPLASARPAKRGDDAGRRDLADRVVAGVGDIDVARAVDRERRAGR